MTVGSLESASARGSVKPGITTPLSFVGRQASTGSNNNSPDVSSAKKAQLDQKRADLRAQIAEAQQELLKVEAEEALQAEQLPGAAAGEAVGATDDKLAVADYAPTRALVERLEAQLSLNRTLLVEITSEEKDLEAQKEELEEHASGLQQAFNVALDTPLQSAIYTIQQLLHEDGVDSQTAAGLSTILKELTAANPYLPTFNFSGSDLADDTKNWIATTFCGDSKSPVASSASPKLSRSPTAACGEDAVMERAMETLDFDLWEYDEERLVDLTVLLFRKSGLMETFKVDEGKLRAFVNAVREGYRPNPFHNFRHGFDVLQVVAALTSGLALRQLRPLELLAMFITSLCVDLDHGGVSDLFLVNTQSPLAQLYNNISVNENHHCACVWKMLSQPELNITENLASEQWRELRGLVVKIFMGTDMSKHFDVLTKFKLRVDAEQFDLQNQEDRTVLCCAVVHAADLANVSRPFDLAAKWAALHAEEQWRQGDTEKTLGVPVSLMCERQLSPTDITQAIGALQVDFCDYVVGPTWNQLASALGGDDPVIREAQRNMANNRARWAAERGELRLPPSASSYDADHTNGDAPPPTPMARSAAEGPAENKTGQADGSDANKTAPQQVQTSAGGGKGDRSQGGWLCCGRRQGSAKADP